VQDDANTRRAFQRAYEKVSVKDWRNSVDHVVKLILEHYEAETGTLSLRHPKVEVSLMSSSDEEEIPEGFLEREDLWSNVWPAPLPIQTTRENLPSVSFATYLQMNGQVRH